MNKKTEVSSSLTGAVLSLLSALGLISCCGFPILAGALAWLGIGASQLSFLEKYHTLITIFAIAALLYSFYILYVKELISKKDHSSNLDPSCCSTPKKGSNKIAKLFFWIGVLAVAFSIYSKNANAKPEVQDSCCETEQTETKTPPASSCCSSNQSETK